MTMTSDFTLVTKVKRKEIKDTVLDLLFGCNINDLPVELQSILTNHVDIVLFDSSKAKQHSLIENDYFDYDGETIRFEGKFYIIFNAKHPKVRQRWTIAHEMGHIFLNHDDWTPVNEAEANYFAKELLEPIAVLADVGAITVGNIAKVCGVSKEAAEYRIKDLKRHYDYKAKYGLTNHDIRFLKQFGRIEIAAELCPAM